MSDRKRPMNLTMCDRSRAKITALKEQIDSDSPLEVIRSSVELLEILLERESNGDAIILRASNGTEKRSSAGDTK